MRWAVLCILALDACDAGDSPGADAGPDALLAADASAPDSAPIQCPAGGFSDGGVEVCAALAGSADVAAATSVGDFDFAFMHAGGTYGSPVAPGLQAPFSSVVLYLTTVPAVDADALWRCERSPSSDCCTFGPVAVVRAELSGAALGQHAATVEVIASTGNSVAVDATVTLTTVDDPSAPAARLAGAISADGAGAMLAGDFDGELCPSLIVPLI